MLKYVTINLFKYDFCIKKLETQGIFDKKTLTLHFNCQYGIVEVKVSQKTYEIV